MTENLQLRERLRSLAGPVNHDAAWAQIQRRAGQRRTLVSLWDRSTSRMAGLAAFLRTSPSADEAATVAGHAEDWPDVQERESATRRRSPLRVAVYASIAVVLVAAVAVGSLEAAKHLGKDQPILVITDETTVTTEAATVTSTPQTTLTTAPAVAPTLGRNWEHLPLAAEGGAVHGLVMDPSNSAVLYAITDWGLFKSTDGAAHWTKLSVEADWAISAILVDPASPSTLYVAGPLGDYRSLDGGATWTQIGGMVDGIADHLWWIDSSTSPSTLWAMVDGGDGPNIFYKSTDGGSTWEEVSRAFLSMGQPITVGSINPMLYANGMRSFDGGVTWEDVSAGLPVDPGRVVLDPRDSSRLYLYPDSYLETLEPPVFVSTDKAQTWTELTGPELDWAKAVFLVDPATPAAAIEAAAAFLTDFDGTVTDASSGVQVPSEGGWWQRQPWRVVLDPGDPSVVYVRTSQGVYKSTDQGATWNKASPGMTAPAVYSVLVDPFSPSTIYAIASASIVKSTDGGASWVAILPLAQGQVPFDGALLLAPSLPTRLYAATPNGLLRSDDGGVTWTQLAASRLLEPTPENPEVDLRLMLVASDQPDTVFVKAYGDSWCGLYRSTDGGNTWDQVAGLPDSPGDISLVEAPDDPSRLYAGVAGGKGEGPASNGFFKSTDGGKTWAPAGDWSSWGDGISALAIDPHNPLNLYAAAAEISKEGYRFAWHSTDGGETWTQVTYNDVPSLCIPEIIFDPRAPGTLYARTFGSYGAGALYRSTDGGATWQNMIEGRDDIFVFSCVIDPASSNGLYAATDQGLYKWMPDE